MRNLLIYLIAITLHGCAGIAASNRADNFQEAGQFREAELHYQMALDNLENEYGHDNSLMATTLNNLAALYIKQGRYMDAERMLQRSLSIKTRRGMDNEIGAPVLHNLGELYRLLARYHEAESFYKQGLALWEKSEGAEYHDLVLSYGSLAELTMDQGNYANAASYAQKALFIAEINQAARPVYQAYAHGVFGKLYAAQGRFSEAERSL